jgi:hypothetical protein
MVILSIGYRPAPRLKNPNPEITWADLERLMPRRLTSSWLRRCGRQALGIVTPVAYTVSPVVVAEVRTEIEQPTKTPAHRPMLWRLPGRGIGSSLGGL